MSCQYTENILYKGREKGDFFPHTLLGRGFNNMYNGSIITNITLLHQLQSCVIRDVAPWIINDRLVRSSLTLHLCISSNLVPIPNWFSQLIHMCRVFSLHIYVISTFSRENNAIFSTRTERKCSFRSKETVGAESLVSVGPEPAVNFPQK